jgi:antitoxin (DNA-binding transcriptional repressor) of toxin-antitoxin stability system
MTLGLQQPVISRMLHQPRYQNVTFVLLKNGEPFARLVPENEKVCVGRDLAEALAKANSPRSGWLLSDILTIFLQCFLTSSKGCDTMSHMKKITIRELHEATGRWVRQASAGEVYVTERGRLVAKIIPASPMPAKPFFAHPKFTRAFLAQRKYFRSGTDSTQTISEEREHEVL